MGGFFGGGGASVDLASPPAIGNTTPNTGAFTTLSANNGTITTSSPAFTLAQTWNAGAQTFTALRVNATDTASASGSLLMDLQVGGSSVFKVDKNGSAYVRQGSYNNSGLAFGSNLNTGIYFGSSWFFFNVGGAVGAQLGSSGFNAPGASYGLSAAGVSSPDVVLTRDAADIIAQRRTTTAQTFRLYNTYTDASNYERGFFRWNTNVLEIGAEKAGTGSDREFKILTSVGYATFSGYFLTSNLGATFETIQAGVGTAYSRLDSSGIKTRSSFSIGWVSGTNTAVAADTALGRNAAGVVEVNNGTAGTFRDLIVRNFRMSAPTGVPTANNSTGTEGSIRWDADYIYICTATNTWKRVAIATW